MNQRKEKYLRQTMAVISMIVLFITAEAIREETRHVQAGPESAAILPVVQTVALKEDKPDEPEARVAPWAHELGECTVTYYDVCILCCGKTDGITASGAVAVPYETCAVDPAVIPLGSTVLVDFGDGAIHTYRAEDVGGAVVGNHVDLCVASHQEAETLGIMSATVYWEEG